jgi:uncharacterized membrane protein
MQGVGKIAGLIAGLVFGIIWVELNFADAVLVLVLGLIGLYVGGVVSGEIALGDVVTRLNRSR